MILNLILVFWWNSLVVVVVVVVVGTFGQVYQDLQHAPDKFRDDLDCEYLLPPAAERASEF